METPRTKMRTLYLALTACPLIGGCLFYGGSGDPKAENDSGQTTENCLTNIPLVITSKPSPNFDRRKLPVSMIILHYTGAPFRESLNALTNGRGRNRVSSHYLVAEDGAVYRLVDESNRAWHAGVSRWDGIVDINSASIGIEIVNSGLVAGTYYKPYPQKQIEVVTRLCLDIQSRHNIKAVIGHSDIAPGRKIDPGPLFPWSYLKANGVKVLAH